MPTPSSLFGAIVVGAVALQPALAATPEPTPRQIVTSADQMPRRSYTLPQLPSELLQAPSAALAPTVEAYDRDLAHDLATLDIRDRSARTALLSARAQIAMFRGDGAAATAFLREVRAQQEKEADRLTSGVLLETLLLARQAGGSQAEQRARFQSILLERWRAMPWSLVGDNLKSTKGSLEVLSANLLVGALQANLDPAARNLNLVVPASMLDTIVSARNTLTLVLPWRDEAVAVLQGLTEKNQVARVDRWTPRQVVLAPNARAKPVVVGIWDSGTDVALFPHPTPAGIAFDKHMRPTTPLVRPMGEIGSRLPTLKQYLRGYMDLQAAIDSDAARTFKRHMAGLQPDQVKPFLEDVAAATLWAHGTHVAGIAVAGNPFARVAAVSMHLSSDSVPEIPDEAGAARTAAAYRAAVEFFRKSGARVVNMSWVSTPAGFEEALTYHNVGASAAERKQRARLLFDMDKQALATALRSAPEILFVAASGNDDSSADFADYVPAGLQLPNLITVGAVDVAGRETAFSNFGQTVVVHANGFEVESLLPGGEKIVFSGTSMAAPQVANLAAKLFALKPELTPEQAKSLILRGAERNGRVNLIDPRKTLELAGVAP